MLDFGRDAGVSSWPPARRPQPPRGGGFFGAARQRSIRRRSRIWSPAMAYTIAEHLRAELAGIAAQGLYKRERVISTPQSATIRLADGREVINFCANNYLGLADHPEVIAAAKQALDARGYGLASVRFICGTQDLHKQLEERISAYFGTEDTILYAACFDANGGLFEPLLGPEDAIISDALNHASIIDGVRLCKARRYRYANCDMAELEAQLQAAQDARFRMITTDGVFSMDGAIAPLDRITALAEQYGALVHIDECHATGFVGPTGRGTAELYGVMDKIDVYTSTLGKALGGGLGGFTTGRREIIEILRQRSRPYLFSNSLPPAIVAASLKVFELLEGAADLRRKLADNTARFRAGMTAAGFTLKPGQHPITPVMLGDAKLAQDFAARLLDHGIYVIGFFYPVVPQGQARIRVQISAVHETAHIDQAIAAFTAVGRALGVVA
jgi:glycine C-acetyltransferase